MLLKKLDRQDFERLVTPQLEAAYRFAYHLTGQEADAQDLLQEACHQALLKFHLYQSGTNFKAWFFRLIKNLHIDRYRRRKRAPGMLALSDAALVLKDENPGAPIQDPWWEKTPAGVIENEQVFYDLFGDEVNRFLGELPADFRTTLLLCDVEEMSYQEISEVLECPVGTVRSRISRARSYLKDRLYQYARGLGYVKEPIS